VLVLRLLAYLLWIPALFAVIVAVILPVVGSGILPEELPDRFAHPSNRTSGYRVEEDILRPGKPFYVFAVPGELGGEPIMAGRYQDVWAISADPMLVSLARGGRRTRSWAVRFGLAGLALFALSAVLLMRP
jgi:hypothetical protein